MSRSSWRREADAILAKVHAALPADASLSDRKRAVDDARPGWVGMSWPRKMWQEQRRAYLRTFGYRSKAKGPQQSILDLLPRDPVTGRPMI